MRSSEGGASLRAERRDGVLTLTMNRPERRNALDAELRDALAAAIDQAATDDSVSAVLLTGAGGVFCAGGDLGRFEDLHDPRTYRHLSYALTRLMEALESLEKPAIAVIDGVATGVGLTLALSCDWRIATPRARLLFREGRLGLVPTHGGIARLVKLIGLARAQEALLGGDELDAAASVRLGLISELVEDDPIAAAHRRAELMKKRAPLSFGAAKRLLHLAADSDLRSTILAEGLAQTALLQSDDHREGLSAARERREPVFAGR